MRILIFPLVQPVNVTMLSWELNSIPSDWPNWRDQWEYGHADRALLLFGALAVQVFSVIQETPTEASTTSPVAGAKMSGKLVMPL